MLKRRFFGKTIVYNDAEWLRNSYILKNSISILREKMAQNKQILKKLTVFKLLSLLEANESKKGTAGKELVW